MKSNHPLQTTAWATFRKTMGIVVHTLTDGSILTFHHIPHTPWTIGYFPKGPYPTAWSINELKKIGKQKNALFIQLEPNVISSRSIVHSSQLTPSHHPLFTKYTFVLDLTKSEDELMKHMHPKTRYNIKVAQKHNVVIQEDNRIDQYLMLSKETTNRQRFFAHNETYQRTMWQIMHKSGLAYMFTATYKEKILASWIIFALGDTIYYPYGASSTNNREVMAPTLMLWEIAKWGKRMGYKKFDLWGALGPNPNQQDPFYGFHRFKQGFHPELIEYVGSYDLILKPFLYTLYCIVDDIRWFFLKLKT